MSIIIQALGIALAAAVAAVGIQTWRLSSLKTEIAEERAAAVQVALAHSENTRRLESTLQARADETARTLSARLAAARRDADGLRESAQAVDRAASEVAGTASGGDGERVGRLAGLLGECARLVGEGAERVERLDARISGLQRHAAEVSGLPLK